jgi:poly-gamma-glutamate synthesis protein (capsule biosynthesis protein)
VTALLPPPARAFAATISDAPPLGRSWRGDDARCPRLTELALVRVDHVTFDGGVAIGELVVARAIASRAVALFRRLHALGFPIRRMQLVDAFDAADDASMAADNTSAFNFRTVAGTSLLSQHARGLAIDINPVENPWRWGSPTATAIVPAASGRKPGGFVPVEGAPFVDRARVRPGMIVRPGPVVAALDELGFEWGGDWRHASDDHHVVAIV